MASTSKHFRENQENTRTRTTLLAWPVGFVPEQVMPAPFLVDMRSDFVADANACPVCSSLFQAEQSRAEPSRLSVFIFSCEGRSICVVKRRKSDIIYRCSHLCSFFRKTAFRIAP